MGDPGRGVLPDGKDLDYFCDNGPPFKTHTDKDSNEITYWVLSKRGEKTAKRSDTARSYGPPKDGPRFHWRHLNARNQTVSTQSKFVEQLVTDNSTSRETAYLC